MTDKLTRKIQQVADLAKAELRRRGYDVDNMTLDEIEKLAKKSEKDSQQR